MKNSCRVAFEFFDLRHSGVLPEAQLVLRESVAGEDLLLVPVPLKGADLAAGVDGVQEVTGLRIPELYATVGGTASGGEEVAIVRGPGQSFHSSLVIRQRETRPRSRRLIDVPQAQFVIVASAATTS